MTCAVTYCRMSLLKLSEDVLFAIAGHLKDQKDRVRQPDPLETIHDWCMRVSFMRMHAGETRSGMQGLEAAPPLLRS
jgi:hypothetical protein